MISRRHALLGASIAAAVPALPLLIGASNSRSRRRRIINSAYVGNAFSAVAGFESFLGRKLDGIQLHCGRASISDYTSSVQYVLRSPQLGIDTAHIPIFTMPMFCYPAEGYGSESLSTVAGGLYDNLWKTNASYISAHYPADVKQIYVRLGEEFNGDWMPWTATAATAADFIAAWRRMRNIYATTDSRFVFEWCPTAGQNGAGWDFDWSLCYPGDDVVDLIGMDVYWDTTGGYQSGNPLVAFNAFVDATNGLVKHQTFAAARRKQTTFHEWGQHQEGEAWVRHMAAWFDAHGPLYQGYWDQPDTGFQISNNQYPQAAAAYIAAFGR